MKSLPIEDCESRYHVFDIYAFDEKKIEYFTNSELTIYYCVVNLIKIFFFLKLMKMDFYSNGKLKIARNYVEI